MKKRSFTARVFALIGLLTIPSFAAQPGRPAQSPEPQAVPAEERKLEMRPEPPPPPPRATESAINIGFGSGFTSIRGLDVMRTGGFLVGGLQLRFNDHLAGYAQGNLGMSASDMETPYNLTTAAGLTDETGDWRYGLAYNQIGLGESVGLKTHQGFGTIAVRKPFISTPGFRQLFGAEMDIGWGFGHTAGFCMIVKFSYDSHFKL